MLPPRNRKPGPQRTPAGTKTGPKHRKRGSPRSAGKQEEEEEEEAQAADIDEAFRAISENGDPIPIRYNPQTHDLSVLRETWPSLPTDTVGHTNSALVKLSWLSGRYPNGYVSPKELGERVYKGQNVLFSSEEEKYQALEEAAELARKRANRISQQKDELIEPKEIAFEGITAEDRQRLLAYIVKGEYPKPESASDKLPALNTVVGNLQNNHTYQSPGKSSQFVTKLNSLLSTGRLSS